jgi:hypothetical protein
LAGWMSVSKQRDRQPGYIYLQVLKEMLFVIKKLKSVLAR